jgi:phosphohistidine phosphatase SixA
MLLIRWRRSKPQPVTERIVQKSLEEIRPYGMCHENFISHSPREVEWEDTALPDKDRPLSDRGRRDVPKMGKRLAKRDVKPDLILSSPARRALTTAEIIAKKLDYKRKDIVADDRLYAGAVP